MYKPTSSVRLSKIVKSFFIERGIALHPVGMFAVRNGSFESGQFVFP